MPFTLVSTHGIFYFYYNIYSTVDNYLPASHSLALRVIKQTANLCNLGRSYLVSYNTILLCNLANVGMSMYQGIDNVILDRLGM